MDGRLIIPTRILEGRANKMKQVIQVNVTTQLTTEECCVCGVDFAMPTSLRDKLLETGKYFYCPNGHAQHFAESTEVKLRRANQFLREERAYSMTLRDQRDGALRQVSAHKGVVTRMKTRVQAGVCTECHRHFENLERHMKTKHGK